MTPPVVTGAEYQLDRVLAIADGDGLLRVDAPDRSTIEQGRPLLGLGLALGLRYGFVPSPYTLRAGVFTAATGETLSGGHERVALELAAPAALAGKIRTPALGADRMREGVAAALRRVVARETPRRILFMQSAGKDSSVLAIALAGIRQEWPTIPVQPVTYDSGVREDEAPLVRDINRSLGLPPPTVVRQDLMRELELATAFLAASPRTVGDLALVAYLACLDRVSAGQGDLVVDGLGGDLHMGVGVSIRQRALLALALRQDQLARLGGAARSFRMAYVLDRLDCSRVEQIFPGSRLTLSELKSAFPDDTLKELKRVRHGLAGQVAGAPSVHAWRTALLRLQECHAAIEKVRLACAYFGCTPTLPLASGEVTQVIQSLHPDLKLVGGLRPSNKVVVRTMLARVHHDKYIAKVKGSFRWNVSAFTEQGRVRLISDLRDRQLSEIDGNGLVAAVMKHRCSELRARKLYIAWNYMTWAAGRQSATKCRIEWQSPEVCYVRASGWAGP